MAPKILLSFLVLAMAAAAGQTPQLTAPPDVNLFGNEYPHTVCFQDGRSLRGEIISVGKDEILLSRPDASEPLRFARTDCERLEFSKPEPSDRSFQPNNPPAPPLAVTAQLAGASWLAGELRSADGETFTLAGGNGLHFAIPRAQIRWLYAGEEPAPLFAFTAKDSGMQSSGWWGPGTGTDGPVARGKAVTGVSWIEHVAPKTPRFEVAFVLPEDAEDGAQLSFEETMGGMLPTGPGSYKTVIQLEFGSDALVRHAGGSSPLGGRPNDSAARRPIPEAAQAAAGPVAYRLFFDGAAKRLIVWRNGVQIDDWSFGTSQAPAGISAPAASNREGLDLCFARGLGDELKIDQIRAFPWNGVLPPGDAAAGDGGTLCTPPDRQTQGRLSAISGKGWTFAGEDKPPQPGTLFLLPNHPSAPADPDSRVVFGKAGELEAADFRFERGHFHACLSEAEVQAPAAALQTVLLPRSGAFAGSDLLVFKAGDELRGSLVSAASGHRLRWRLPGGQEVDFELGGLAGVRFSMGPAPEKIARGNALIELRSGDRLRADLAGLDEKEIHLRHALLGALTIPRANVWKLYADPAFPGTDEDDHPETWMREGAGLPEGTSPAWPALGDWRYFDGQYFVWRYDSSMRSLPNLGVRLPPTPTPFEVSFQATHPSRANSSPPAFTVSAAGVTFTIYTGSPKASVSASVPGLIRRDNETFPTKVVLGATVEVQMQVDPKTGLGRLCLNGLPVFELYGKFSESDWPKKNLVKLTISAFDDVPTTFSNLRIRPWAGVPASGMQGKLQVGLANGDALIGTVRASAEGKLSIESEAGPVEVPFDKIQCLDFGGSAAPERANARLRLADGSLLQVDDFHLDAAGISGHSAVVGDFHLPPSALAELALDPPVLHFPSSVGRTEEGL